MKKIWLAALASVVFSSTGFSQLTSNSNLTIQQYVQEVLLGQNVSVSNITFNSGSANVSSTAVGGFECVDCNLGIGSGFVMSSGGVDGVVGPNNSTGMTTTGTGTFQGSDPDLLALVQANGGNSINDWAIIEFDFVPLGDTLRFNYVWGSEEYDTYVGSGFNDVFGFFLSGPGISGPFSNNAENIALVPGTNVGVAINTINNGNGNNGPCQNCAYYNQLDSDGDAWQNMDDDIHTNPFYMQFDGYTDVLTAVGIVQCGQTYHIKLAICDANDGALDSGIFLERDSFSSNLVVQVNLNFEVGGPDGNSLYEDCGTGNLVFTRPLSNDTQTNFVAYLEYDGTAIMGVDYSELPDSIVFAPGVETVSVPIDAFTDGITEGSETVHMTITNLAQCSETFLESEFEFYINDEAEPLVVDGYEQHICAGGTVELTPIISGGYAVYGYSWSTGASTESISVNPATDMVYNVIVTDTCGMPSDDADISVIVGFPPISMTVDPDPVVLDCFGVNVTANATGGDGDFTYFWADANGNDMFGWQNTLWLSSWNFTDEITVTATDGCGETGEVTFYPTSSQEPMIVDVDTDVVVGCAGPYTIMPIVSGGTEPFWYNWYDANWNWLGQGSSLDYNITGNSYINFSVSDNCGNYYSAIINFSIQPVPIDVTLPQNLSGGCLDLFTIAPTINGGGGSFTYEWTESGNIIGTNQTLLFTTMESTTVTINVEDNCGGVGVASTDITINIVPPVITLSEDQTGTCIEEKTFTAEATSGEPQYTFTWFVGGAAVGSGNVFDYQAFESTEITCEVTDACGTTDEGTVMLNIYNPPLTVDVTSDTTICRGDDLMLSATTMGGVGMITYFWPTVLDETENTLATVTVSPGATQEYDVIVMDQCLQEATAEVDVEVQDVDASFETTYLTDVDIQALALSADSCLDCEYSWNFGDGVIALGDSVVHAYDGLDQYQIALTVTNEIGCTRTEYQVVYPPVMFFVPNAFTPDGDGINDVWKFHVSGVTTFHLQVFNRWGDVIFVSDNPDQPWTGNVKAGEHFAQDNVYSWYLEYTGVDGDAQKRSGSVVVLR